MHDVFVHISNNHKTNHYDWWINDDDISFSHPPDSRFLHLWWQWNPEDSAYLGVAKVPLISLANNKPIKGTFELKQVSNSLSAPVLLINCSINETCVTLVRDVRVQILKPLFNIVVDIIYKNSKTELPDLSNYVQMDEKTTKNAKIMKVTHSLSRWSMKIVCNIWRIRQ